MAGYLDEYGVADARREQNRKYIAITLIVVVIVGITAFYFFRNRTQESTVNAFVAALREKNYQAAYAMWGCTPSTPCKYYSAERFLEDWGEKGTYKKPSDMKVEHADACDTGVVFDISYPGADNIGLWVERKTNILSFAPWSRCPGPHLQIVEFLRSRFGGGTK